MALKKPSHFFEDKNKKQGVVVPEEQKLPESFAAYKNNVNNVEVLNEFINNFGSFSENISKPIGHGPFLHRRRLVAGKSTTRLSGGCERSGDDSQSDSAESMPARKASLSSCVGVRTDNRHWWATVSTVRRSREPSLRNYAI